MKKRKIKNDKVELADELALERKDLKDSSKAGYNYVGDLNNWTSLEEQKMRVSEIEKKTGKK